MKYTKLERNWVMYDVGNSALVLLNTSVVPIYFNAINTGASSADLVVAWGNAQTIASLVIAMLMPILGALADYAGNKIKFFLGFFLTGLVLCLAQFKVGRMLGRRYGDAVAGGQSLGQKNTVLAVWMAQSFLDPIASIAPTAYIVWQNFVNSYQIYRKDRENLK